MGSSQGIATDRSTRKGDEEAEVFRAKAAKGLGWRPSLAGWRPLPQLKILEFDSAGVLFVRGILIVDYAFPGFGF